MQQLSWIKGREELGLPRGRALAMVKGLSTVIQAQLLGIQNTWEELSCCIFGGVVFKIGLM